MTIFKYNNKIYETPNLEKKLKRMKISINEIEIIDKKEVKKEEQIEDNVELFYYINPITKYKICSIYDKIPDGYIKSSKEEYYA